MLGTSTKRFASGTRRMVARPRVEALETRTLMNAASEAFVSAVYPDLLHRPVDPSGLEHWSRFLEQGMSRTDVAREITRSLEYRTNLVQNLYGSLLGRAADPTGLRDALSFIAAGGTS